MIRQGFGGGEVVFVRVRAKEEAESMGAIALSEERK